MSEKVNAEIQLILEQQTHKKWIIRQDSELFSQFFQDYHQQFQPLTLKISSPHILLVHRDPLHFLAAFLAAIANNCPVFLANPQWQASEWENVAKILNPDHIVGEIPINQRFNPRVIDKPRQLPSHAIMIPTGGSSGQIRFAIHTWQTLTASVRGFCDYFQVKAINSCCVLPIYHVSGLMAFLRSFLSGGQFWLSSYKMLEQDIPQGLNLDHWFISLVPTQLQLLLKSAELTQEGRWLAQFGTILLGGAPAWSSLLQTARSYRLNLALTYGMTETASQIVTLKPSEFLAGNRSSGQVLPHARVQIQTVDGRILPRLERGIVAIQAKSQYLGYYPALMNNSLPILTDDMGYLDESGYLYIIGRNNQKIVTGGENVYPSEVESALLATHLLLDVAVVGICDRRWGQAIVAIYVPLDPKITPENLQQKLKNQITAYKIPKYWLAVEILPRNAQGKFSYVDLQRWAMAKLGVSEL